MKKFFTLIAAVALAAGVNAQTYELSGLKYSDLTYESDAFAYDETNDCLNYNKADKSNWSTIQVGKLPLSLAYKNSSTKKKCLNVKDTYLQTGGKGWRVIVTGLTSGQEFTITVASKGSTAAEFEAVEGCTAATTNPTLEAKGDELAFVDLKFTASADTATILENAGGFAISKLVIGGDTPNGISQVEAAKANVNAPLYNLAGQRVDKAYKGIVIQNGRKFFNK